uniref:Uncharacterized protein n=1 Tax=Aegilops tauschii subsp. strangulata TaxID=200361 RepID=A0A453HW42_AEGTS
KADFFPGVLSSDLCVLPRKRNTRRSRSVHASPLPLQTRRSFFPFHFPPKHGRRIPKSLGFALPASPHPRPPLPNGGDDSLHAPPGNPSPSTRSLSSWIPLILASISDFVSCV